jgi:hypothetical protein
MIYVLMWPETWLEKIKFQLKGTTPSIACDEIRYGAGIIECIHAEANSCTAIPTSRILRIVWDGGYSQAVAKVKAEFMKRMQDQMNGEPGTEPSSIDPAVMGQYQ